MDKYFELVKLQKETIGATFTMGYSTRSNKHYVVFNHPKKRFEYDTIEEALDAAISYVRDSRHEHNDDIKFTLYSY